MSAELGSGTPALAGPQDSSGAVFPGESQDGLGLPISPSFPHTQLPPTGHLCRRGEPRAWLTLQTPAKADWGPPTPTHTPGAPWAVFVL